VTWADGWPVIGAVAPVMTAPPWPPRPAAEPPARDDFDLARLHPQWVSVRSRPAGHCSTQDRPGWLTLRANGASIDDPDVTFVGRRQQHLSCRARALADAADGRGGLAVRLDERHHYEIEVADGEVRVWARIGPLRQTVAAAPAPPGPVVLRIDVLASPLGLALAHPLREPDLLSVGIEDQDGEFTVLAELDGRYLSTEVAGGFTGRVIGLYATAGTVRFDWFDYEPLADPRA
jgi:beta-xylosidase